MPENPRERFLTTYHERDYETGLDYRGARFYDGDVGRFLSLDPLAADFAAWSPYNYVMGNPIILVDPTGKAPEQVDDPPEKEERDYWNQAGEEAMSILSSIFGFADEKAYLTTKVEAKTSLGIKTTTSITTTLNLGNFFESYRMDSEGNLYFTESPTVTSGPQVTITTNAELKTPKVPILGSRGAKAQGTGSTSVDLETGETKIKAKVAAFYGNDKVSAGAFIEHQTSSESGRSASFGIEASMKIVGDDVKSSIQLGWKEKENK